MTQNGGLRTSAGAAGKDGSAPWELSFVAQSAPPCSGQKALL
jgi:hypothetical protein